MLSAQTSEPRIDRTEFDRLAPPEAITLYYCPACGQRIMGEYGLEPARAKCTKKWHLVEAEAVRYVRERGRTNAP